MKEYREILYYKSNSTETQGDLGKDGMSMLSQNRLDRLYHKVNNNNNSNNEIGKSYTI
jgi:hypothetical protein